MFNSLNSVFFWLILLKLCRGRLLYSWYSCVHTGTGLVLGTCLFQLNNKSLNYSCRGRTLLCLSPFIYLWRKSANSCELEWTKNMKLGAVAGNDVHEPNTSQNFYFWKAMPLTLIHLKFNTQLRLLQHFRGLIVGLSLSKVASGLLMSYLVDQ